MRRKPVAEERIVVNKKNQGHRDPAEPFHRFQPLLARQFKKVGQTVYGPSHRFRPPSPPPHYEVRCGGARAPITLSATCPYERQRKSLFCQHFKKPSLRGFFTVRLSSGNMDASKPPGKPPPF